MNELPRILLQDLESTSQGAPIAQGGRGTIYPARPRRKLSPEIVLNGRYLLKRPRNLPKNVSTEALSRHLDEIHKRLNSESYFKSRLAMPLAVVEKDGEFFGYLMPEFSEGCYFTKTFSSGESKPALQELKIFLNSEQERQVLGVPYLDLGMKIAALADIFETLAKLHESGLVVGDFSGSNLVLQNKATRKSNLRVLFLDVDSFSYKGGNHPLGLESTLHWRSPEEVEDGSLRANRPTDVYKASLLVRRLLHQEENTGGSSYDLYRSKISTNVMETISGANLSELIARALDPKPSARPRAMELAFHFRQAAEKLQSEDDAK